MIGQVNKLQLLAYSLVLGIGYAQKNLVANWFASRVRSFASFCRLKMLGSHERLHNRKLGQDLGMFCTVGRAAIFIT